MNELKCVVCGANNWRPIPDPVRNRAITTAGIVIDHDLAKSQCMNCGLGVRTGDEFLAKTDYYEERYADYYRRPGATAYDAHRYVAMANWMKTALGDFRPGSILDVGCGAGWSMAEVMKVYPQAEIEGIEPSKANSAIALKNGFKVHVLKAGESAASRKQYDLIYSHNVLTHVNDPVAFLAALKNMLADGGRIVQLTVDATVPSNELLWCDHNYSFLPAHLVKFADKAGLVPLRCEENPDDVTILNKQLMIFAKDSESDRTIDRLRADRIDTDDLFSRREAYIDDWKKTNDSLHQKIAGYDRVVNFGASMWTWLLAGFCPDYWSQVSLCTVDGFDGKCVDREVVDFAKIEWKKGDCLVLGINPLNQDRLKARFEGQPFDVVTWNEHVRI